MSISTGPAPGAVAPTATPFPVRRKSPFAALLVRLHFYAGVLVAPFLLVAAVTGLLYTVTPQLDAFVYHDELTVADRGDARGRSRSRSPPPGPPIRPGACRPSSPARATRPPRSSSPSRSWGRSSTRSTSTRTTPRCGAR